MAVPADFAQGALIALSAANQISLLGGTNTTISGNSTIALVRTAVEALAITAGTAPDALRMCSLGIQLGLNAGVWSSTHGDTTLSGFASDAQADCLPS